VTRHILIVSLFIAVVAVILAFELTPSMRDLEVYWTGAVRAAAGEPLYRAEDNHYQYKYLPAFAVLTIPLGWLSEQTARGIWFSLSLLLVPALLILSVKLLPSQREPSWFLYLIAILVMGKYYVRELSLGQVNLLFAVVAVFACLNLIRNRERLGGALTAATVAIKPYGIILLPWLMARRQIAAIAAAAGVFALTILTPVVIYGFEGTYELYRGWWVTVSSTTAPNLPNQDNVSLASLFSRWFGPGTSTTAMATIAGLGLIILVISVFRKRREIVAPEGLELSMLLWMIPLFSPQGWDYVLLIGTPGIVILANAKELMPKPILVISGIAAATMGLTIYDVIGRAAYMQIMRSGVITLCAVTLLFAMGTLRFKRIA
jgi:hypothetical protein